MSIVILPRSPGRVTCEVALPSGDSDLGVNVNKGFPAMIVPAACGGTHEAIILPVICDVR